MMPYSTTRRRGNAIVLAASILVLLVIIATTFVSRTQTARRTASAVQRDAASETSFDGIADSLSTLVSDALFVRLIDAHYDPFAGDNPQNTFAIPRTSWSSRDPETGSTLGQQVIPEVRGVVSQLPTEIATGGQGPPMSRLGIPSENPGLREVSDPNRPRIPAKDAKLGTAFGDLVARFNLESAASWSYPDRATFESEYNPDDPFFSPATAPITDSGIKLGRAPSWLKRYGVDPRFPANFAPYEVVPWTNWPDRPLYPWSPSNGGSGLRGHFNAPETFTPIFSSANPLSPFEDLYQTAGGPGTQSVTPRFSDNTWPSNFANSSNFNFVGVGEGNPLFGPGFGDTRWLRDLEPIAVDAFTAGSDGRLERGRDGISDSFRQWRHLSNVSSAENTWRVVLDISDVTGVRRIEGGYNAEDPAAALWPSLPMVSDLSIPIEQWLPNLPYGEIYDFNPAVAPLQRVGATGTPRLFPSDFVRTGGDLLSPSPLERSWAEWGNRILHPRRLTLLDEIAPPLNFFNLYDLNANGRRAEPGERLSDRYVGVRKSIEPGSWAAVPDNPDFPNGTPAWNISRFLDDADGDGFTDSFWYLPNSSPKNGVLQVVSVSVTDNAGRLDLSSGTRFSPGLEEVPQAGPLSGAQIRQQLRDRGTRGATPGDLALVSQIDDFISGPDHPTNPSGNRQPVAEAKVGFFDIPEHGEAWRQVPGLLNETSFTQLPWPVATANNQPYEPFATNYSGSLESSSLVQQDYNGYHNPGSNFAGSWGNFLDATGWRRWYFREFGQFPNLDEERDAFLTHEERLSFWRDGLGVDNARRLSLSGELELRLVEGHNSSDIFSDAEYMLGSWRHKPYAGEFGGAHPLRSVSVATEEAQAFGGLMNGELKGDLRHRVTTYSMTRNDLLPDWLRWKWDLFFDLDGDGILDAPRVPSPEFEFSGPGVDFTYSAQFSLLIDANGSPYPLFTVNPSSVPNVWNTPQSNSAFDGWSTAYKTLLSQFDRKIDLREANPSQLVGSHFDANGAPTGQALLSRRLSYLLMNALADGDENGAWFGPWGRAGGTYFGMTRDILRPTNIDAGADTFGFDGNFARLEEGFAGGPLGSDNVDPRGHSRLNEYWLRMISTGLAANILSYRDNDWFNPNPSDPLSAFFPRFNDVAPIFPEEAPQNPQLSQQAGLTLFPEWDRATTRDPSDKVVSAFTGVPLGQNPSTPGVTPLEGVLGLEAQPFLAEAAVVFLHKAEAPVDFNNAGDADPCATPGGVGRMNSQVNLPYVTAESEHRVAVAVQLANPFDKPIPVQELAKYRISVNGMHAPLASCWFDSENSGPSGPNAVSTTLLPLEPVSIDRNPSAIFWLDPSAVNYGPSATPWTPGSTNAVVFKQNLINWMGIDTWQDGSTGFAGESPDPDVWGMTGTNRYCVPLAPSTSLTGFESGWAPNRQAYESQFDDGRYVNTQLNLVSGERSVELSRIDNAATLRLAPNLDEVINSTGDPGQDGLVDIANFQSNFCVWVVVDRFDLGQGLDSTANRFLSGSDEITNGQFGNQRVSPSNEFARMLDPTLFDPSAIENQNAGGNVVDPVLYSIPLLARGGTGGPPGGGGGPPGGGGGPGVPPGSGGQDENGSALPAGWERGGQFSFPSVAATSGTPKAVQQNSNSAGTPVFYYQPGLYPPAVVPVGRRSDYGTGRDPNLFVEYASNPNPFSNANAFVQAFGVRRGWLVDTDADTIGQSPATYGVQPSEFSLQFLSANQTTTRLNSECRVYPDVDTVIDLVSLGVVKECSTGGFDVIYEESQTAGDFRALRFSSNPFPPALRVFGSFINVDDSQAVRAPLEASRSTLEQAGQNDLWDRWGGPVRFGSNNPTFIETANEPLVLDSGYFPNMAYELLNQQTQQVELVSLQDFVLTPFAFDGERQAHFFARDNQNDPYPFVFSKSMPRLHSFPQSVNLEKYSPGLVLNHKDSDFDQIGEIMNIPVVGHHLRIVPLGNNTQPLAPGSAPTTPLNQSDTVRRIPTVQTVRTFSEFLADFDLPYRNSIFSDPQPIDAEADSLLKESPTAQHLLLDTPAAGRLGLGRLLGVPDPLSLNAGALGRTAPDFADPRHAHPDLPASARLLDLFTCDGPGFNHDGADGSFFPETSPSGERFDLARGFSQRGTRGLLNLNTASVEALRALPNWYKSVGIDGYASEYQQGGAERFPRTWMAEAAATYRDGYSGLLGTHGLPVNRTFFDLRDTVHTVNPYFNEFDTHASDFPVHLFGGKANHEKLFSPNHSRQPDPSLPELHPKEIITDINSAPSSSYQRAQPARMNSGRGFRALGELRLVDHRQGRGLQSLRPDTDPAGAPLFAPGWSRIYGDPATYEDVIGTSADQQFDNESFSAYSMAGTNSGSPPFWPFRQKVRKSMERQLGKQNNAWDLLETDNLTLELGPAFGQYLSPYERADHVLQDNMPIQQSLTASVDVGGNWNASVKSDPVTGNPVLAQDASGGDLEDANLLIAGAANLLTTRSDSFVAHFRVRSFRQNPETGIWDATDPSAIVDERRFVMLIDRSNVNEPGDQPDILFLEEAPN